MVLNRNKSAGKMLEAILSACWRSLRGFLRECCAILFVEVSNGVPSPKHVLRTQDTTAVVFCAADEIAALLFVAK